ncbi:hypothetical protein [Shinella sp. M31]|uniref:hypothetical protein n=1 Tax=Shinella sp. M31 TaxID=3368615 RepID=UPI003BA11056
MPDTTALTPAKKKTCFVVGPIGSEHSESRIHADWLLEMIIQPVFEQHFEAFEVIRSDTITQPGMIDAQMIGHLLDADLVIADMSERNPNAFYEMGIRHMTSRPIIHMFLKGTEIPFDVAPYRAIDFSRIHPSDIRKAQARLKEAVEAVQHPDYKVENPVTRARGVQKLADDATPGMQVLIQQIADLSTRMHRIEGTEDHSYGNVRRSLADRPVFQSRTPDFVYRVIFSANYASPERFRIFEEQARTTISAIFMTGGANVLFVPRDDVVDIAFYEPMDAEPRVRFREYLKSQRGVLEVTTPEHAKRT